MYNSWKRFTWFNAIFYFYFFLIFGSLLLRHRNNETLKSLELIIRKMNKKIIRRATSKKVFSFLVTIVKISTLYFKKRPEWLVKVHRIMTKSHEAIRSRTMRKITVNHQDNSLTRTELRHRYLRWKMPEILRSYLGWWLPNLLASYLNRQTHGHSWQ